MPVLALTALHHVMMHSRIRDRDSTHGCKSFLCTTETLSWTGDFIQCDNSPTRWICANRINSPKMMVLQLFQHQASGSDPDPNPDAWYWNSRSIISWHVQRTTASKAPCVLASHSQSFTGTILHQVCWISCKTRLRASHSWRWYHFYTSG